MMQLEVITMQEDSFCCSDRRSVSAHAPECGVIADEALQIVGGDALEHELKRVRAAAAGALAGVFGPSSVTWQVDREGAIFLGAGRALLLQLAHPWIAAAIEQHSHAFADPIGRFHRTFSVVFSMVFGSLDQSLNAARSLHRRHAEIKGRLPYTAGPFLGGSYYCANAIPALRWVYASLIETAILAYELVLPPLTLGQRERYYSESRLFAALFGIPDEYLPRDWTAFSAYIAAMVQSDTLTITPQARMMARRLLTGADSWLPVPGSYRALTVALLPRRIRETFGFPYGAVEERSARKLIIRFRRIYRSCRPSCASSDHIKRRNNGLQESQGRTSSHGSAIDFGSVGPNCQKLLLAPARNADDAAHR